MGWQRALPFHWLKLGFINPLINTGTSNWIYDKIIFLSRIRGHRNDVNNLSNLISDNTMFEYELIAQEENYFNIGIFKELLMFRIDVGDVNLRNHLESPPKNAIFVSKTIQNNFINTCGSIITDVLIK